MAIDNFKKIEDTKGYLVDDKDRKIFEREISKGYFGINIGDTIEFILYDSSNNPLPQESSKGRTVRYIEYNDNTKKEYFGKTQLNQKNIKSNQSEEFFVDVEKLIKEAGYSNGIFKSQISLLNRRLGSGDRTNDTTWIHEISPSRTEIRILPTIDNDGVPNSDLEERYKCFVDGKTFVADVYPLLDEFVEQFNVQTALENMLTLKGSVTSGQNYIDLIKEEFKIQNFEIYLQQVKDKFVQAVNHYKNNRDYNILSNRYGQPLETLPQLCFGTSEIMDTVTTIIGNCIEYYLPKRNIQEETSLTIEQQETLDRVGEILKTVTSNKNYSSTIPPSISAGIPGCMDPNAKTYNPNATISVPDMCVYADTSENVVIDRPSETKIQIEPKPEIELDPPKPPKPRLCENPAALNYGLPGICIFPLPKDDRPFEVFPTLEYDTPILIKDNITFVIPLGDRERNTTNSPNIFTDQRDINVRGIGFDDEVRMENIGGVAQIANTQTNDRIMNAQQRLVSGTGDLSQVGGRTPGTSVTGVQNNVPTQSGGRTFEEQETFYAVAASNVSGAGVTIKRTKKPKEEK